MVLILLLLFALSCSVHALSLFETEEGANITIQLSSSTKTDLSSLHMNCRLRTVPVKKVIYMFGGEEEPQYQDRQFSGRVQCDREALRLGQVQLHLTRLTPQDSGEYRCEMAANYDSDKGGWRFISTEHFKLNVTQKAAIFMTTAAPTDEQPPGGALTVSRQRTGLYAALGLLGVLGLFALALMVRSIFCAAPPTNLGDMV